MSIYVKVKVTRIGQIGQSYVQVNKGISIYMLSDKFVLTIMSENKHKSKGKPICGCRTNLQTDREYKSELLNCFAMALVFIQPLWG